MDQLIDNQWFKETQSHNIVFLHVLLLPNLFQSSTVASVLGKVAGLDIHVVFGLVVAEGLAATARYIH